MQINRGTKGRKSLGHLINGTHLKHLFNKVFNLPSTKSHAYCLHKNDTVYATKMSLKRQLKGQQLTFLLINVVKTSPCELSYSIHIKVGRASLLLSIMFGY